MRATGIKREKLCRHFGQKMLLRPERCASPKCAFTRRSYPPGVHGQSRRRPRTQSEYGAQLTEKQRLRVVYGISEQMLKRVVRDALRRSQEGGASRNALEMISEHLERRLDNTVYRLGFAPSRAVARQLVSHGHIIVDGRRVTSPSFLVRPGMTVAVRPLSLTKAPFSETLANLAKQRTPPWLQLDAPQRVGKVVSLPGRGDFDADIDLAKIVEFYAR